MLKIDLRVPSGATTDAPLRSMEALLSDAMWLRGAEGASPWPAHGDPARAAQPVTDGADPVRWHAGRRGLPLVRDRQCGYSLQDAIPDFDCWSAAILWSPPPEGARSLLCARPSKARSFVLLWHDDNGDLTLSQAKSEISVTRRRGTGPWRLDYIGTSDGGLHLLGAGESTAARAEGAMDVVRHGSDLLIGCRRARAGREHTLGGAVLGEVILWPHRDVTQPAAAPLRDRIETFFKVEYGHDL